jgi:hypothetical protein
VGLRCSDLEGTSLETDDRTGGILERGPDAGPTEDPGQDAPPLLPESVLAGRFKLRQKLGEGGMGEVWVADQAEPVQRRVAIKVVRSGLDSERMRALIDQEQQALALMDHPIIARVFDATATDSVMPYFVMELVKGIPIVDYCDQQEFTARERLDFFLSVCQAVQHAHQNYSRLPIAPPGNLVASAGVVGNTVQGGQRLRLAIELRAGGCSRGPDRYDGIRGHSPL